MTWALNNVAGGGLDFVDSLLAGDVGTIISFVVGAAILTAAIIFIKKLV